MKIGNTQFNVKSLEAMTKKDFLETYTGKIKDVNKVAKSLNKYFLKPSKK